MDSAYKGPYVSWRGAGEGASGRKLRRARPGAVARRCRGVRATHCPGAAHGSARMRRIDGHCVPANVLENPLNRCWLLDAGDHTKAAAAAPAGLAGPRGRDGRVLAREGYGTMDSAAPVRPLVGTNRTQAGSHSTLWSIRWRVPRASWLVYLALEALLHRTGTSRPRRGRTRRRSLCRADHYLHAFTTELDDLATDGNHELDLRAIGRSVVDLRLSTTEK